MNALLNGPLDLRTRNISHGAEISTLLVRTAAGDASAFRSLYDATAPQLYGIVRRILGPGPAADDVLQEVYAKVWRGAGRFSADTGQGMGWLVTIARHAAIDRLRRERKVQPLEDAHLDALADQAPNAFAQLASKQDAHALMQCIETLPAQSVECIRLAFWNGLSHNELAAQLKAPLGTVKSWLRRALLRLKECLEQ
jgi:RNA polymerase sigma-70 factor, ECF subfamily